MYENMEHDLRTGRLAYLLPRPLSYLGSIFSEGLGILCTNLFVLGIITFGFTWLYTGTIPLTFGAFLTTLGIGLLAGCVGLIFQMIIGLSTFWLQQTGPFHWVWEKLLLTLGGLMLPLAAYPFWLQKIANFTPFSVILGQRSALAIDFNAYQAFQVSGYLIFWGLLGVLGLIFLYRKGLRILNIEGG
jgi:ABC-2 type transport system permease protein